jgi:hypothetical protein
MRTKSFFLTALLVAALAIPVFATTVPKMDLPTLVRQSDDVIQGKVETVEVRVENNDPYTWVRVRVDEPFKMRNNRQTIFIKYLGGRMNTAQGPIEVTISGMPTFQVGENVILFLRASSDGQTFAVNGLGQGKYLVVDETAISNISGVNLVDPKTGKAVPAFSESAPVEALKARIRELVK